MKNFVVVAVVVLVLSGCSNKTAPTSSSSGASADKPAAKPQDLFPGRCESRAAGKRRAKWEHTRGRAEFLAGPSQLSGLPEQRWRTHRGDAEQASRSELRRHVHCCSVPGRQDSGIGHWAAAVLRRECRGLLPLRFLSCTMQLKNGDSGR
jgi:hypothetical protein